MEQVVLFVTGIIIISIGLFAILYISHDVMQWEILALKSARDKAEKTRQSLFFAGFIVLTATIIAISLRQSGMRFFSPRNKAIPPVECLEAIRENRFAKYLPVCEGFFPGNP